MKKVMMLASVASMIDQFNMPNIEILRKQGYKVDIVANFEHGSTSSKQRVIEFKKELEELNIKYYHVGLSRNVTDVFANIRAYNNIKKLMEKNQYDFIHCHSPIGGVCGRLAAKKTKVKSIYTAHGFHFFKGADLLNWLLYYPIEKICSYFTDSLITINKEDYEIANKKMKALKTYYVPGIGIDTKDRINISVDKNQKRKELGLQEYDVMIFSTGELSKRKNHEVIIKALAKINNPNVHYYIAGRGCLEAHLMKISNDLGISKNIHLLGFRKDIKELNIAADIFCFPSYQEGLPVSLMEAMFAGNPVVCSNIRGNIDLIQSESGGILCNPSSEEEFKDAINKIIYNRNLRLEMGRYNKEKIKDFDIQIISNKMESIYRSVAEM